MLRGYDYRAESLTAREWLGNVLGIPGTSTEQLTVFQRPTVMILDVAESLIERFGVVEMVQALTSLRHGPDVKVLIIVTSWQRALELRDVGKCKLIGDAACGRWNYDQLMGVWNTYPLKTRLKWTDDNRASLLRHCVETGAVGELSAYINHHGRFREEQLASRARVLCNEWSMGIRALDGHAEPGDVGIFPDKHGMFHRAMVIV
jgi:hypothetical protein